MLKCIVRMLMSIMLIIVTFPVASFSSLASAQEEGIPPEIQELASNGVETNSAWEPYVQAFDDVEMVLVPAGCFTMGSTDEQVEYAVSLGGGRLLTEQPANQQCFDQPFWIDQYEVTNVQFEQAGGAAASPSRWTDDNRPRETINWFEAREYCALRGARLPTEAEWEYAARGPDNLIFPWGNTFVAENVVYSDNSDMKTAEVGSKPEGVSWVGALDMSGNVGEWTSSTYQDYPYDAADGRENDGGYSSRVLRGGSHADGSLELRAADRLMYTPMGKGWLHGARCARTFDDSSPEEGSTPLEGHTIEGDNVTFVFDQAVYELDEVEVVAVKGNFNDYNAETPGWQLSDEEGDGVWTLQVPLGESIKAGTPFRFVVDGVVLQPPEGVAPDFLVSDSEGGNLLVIGGLESFLANDAIASQLERRTFVDADGGELDYYLLAPEDYDDTQTYPLVVSLHGAGERGDNPSPILPYNGAYEFMETAADYTYFMLTPQAPADRFWGEPDIKQTLLALIAATQEEYSIDPARIYITGLSMGAFGLWELVYESPDTFAAGISICGGASPTFDASQIAHIPFWLFHGTDDPYVPVRESQRLTAALEEAGGIVKYTEYQDAEHWVWVRTYTNPEVIDWLFSQAKS